MSSALDHSTTSTPWIYILQNNDKYQYLSPSYITMKVALNIIYSLGIPVSSTNKADRRDVTEILLKMALNTTNHQYHIICMQNIYDNQFHCNIIFLIQIFLENCFNFTFQCNFTFQWITIESDYFPDGLPAVPYCFMG